MMSCSRSWRSPLPRRIPFKKVPLVLARSRSCQPCSLERISACRRLTEVSSRTISRDSSRPARKTESDSQIFPSMSPLTPRRRIRRFTSISVNPCLPAASRFRITPSLASFKYSLYLRSVNRGKSNRRKRRKQRKRALCFLRLLLFKRFEIETLLKTYFFSSGFLGASFFLSSFFGSCFFFSSGFFGSSFFVSSFLVSGFFTSTGLRSRPRLMSTLGRAFLSRVTPVSVTLVCQR